MVSEKTLESPLDCKEIHQSILKEISPEYSFGHLMRRTDSFEKTLVLGKIEDRRRRGTTENKIVGWHHQLNGHGFEQTLGDGEGQGNLAWCSPWGRKELETTE